MSSREGWIPLARGYVQEIPVGSPRWKLTTFDSLHVAFSITGAFIATSRDETQPLYASDLNEVIIPLRIHTASGMLLLSVSWERETSSILKLGWTDSDVLAVLLDDATIRLYSVFGDFSHIDLGSDARTAGIDSCSIMPECLAVRLKSGKFVVIGDWKNPKPQYYQPPSIPNTSTSLSDWHIWSLVAPSRSASGGAEIFLPVAGSVFQISDTSLQQHPWREVFKIIVSPSLNIIAKIHKSGKIVFTMHGSALPENKFDLHSCFPSVDLKRTQFAWVAEDVLMAVYEMDLLYLHVSGGSYSHELFDHVVLFETTGGCLLLSAQEIMLVQPVQSSAQFVFEVGSKHPGAILVDAFDHSQKMLPEAVEMIEMLLQSRQSTTAISSCIAAAGSTWKADVQKLLLNAALLGRTWSDSERTRDDFTKACLRLRVLNLLRAAGIQCTGELFDRQGGPAAGVRMLLLSGNHKDAFSLALATSPKLVHEVVHNWALLCLKSSNSCTLAAAPAVAAANFGALSASGNSSCDRERLLVQAVVKRLNAASEAFSGRNNFFNANDTTEDAFKKRNIAAADMRVSGFAELARAAFALGKSSFAVSLLEYERDPVQQIPILLEMSQFEAALRKAISSGDKNLVFLSLIYLRKESKLNEFFQTVKRIQGARFYFIEYGKQVDRSLLRDFYFLEDMGEEMGDLIISEADLEADIKLKLKLMGEAVTSFQGAATSTTATAKFDTAQEIRGDNATNSRASTPNFNAGGAISSYSSSSSGGGNAALKKQSLGSSKLKYVQTLIMLYKAQEHLSARGEATENARIAVGQSSLMETVVRLLRRRHYDAARSLRARFKLSETAFAWALLRACCSVGHFEDLDRYLASKAAGSCTLEYKDIVDEMLRKSSATSTPSLQNKAAADTAAVLRNQGGNSGSISNPSFEAALMNYISMCDIKSRADYFRRARNVKDAAKVYYQLGDVGGLRSLQANDVSDNSVESTLIASFIQELETQGRAQGAAAGGPSTSAATAGNRLSRVRAFFK